jgi:prepilin-type processing-associated H-X9-DG protein
MGCLVAEIGLLALAVAFFSEIGRILLFGWIAFLGRTIPRATVNISGVVSGAVTLVLLVGLIHYFGRWLLRASSAEPGDVSRRWRFRWSLCIVGTVILMFAVGYASIGLARHLGWVFSSGSMYAPRVYGSGWPHAAANAEEVNNLKMLGLGFRNYCSVHTSFPSDATYAKSGEPLHSWATLILPYLNYWPNTQLDVPWNHPTNIANFRSPIPEFYNPTLDYADQFDGDGLALIHYAGNSKVLNAQPGMKLSDVTDGEANTILVGEVNGNFQPWGKPGNWRDPAAGINTPDGFGGAAGSGGAQFLMVDGSVRFISKDVDPQVLKALSTPAGGEKLPENWGVPR